VNDSPLLENEANVLGKKAAEGKSVTPENSDINQVIRKKEIEEDGIENESESTNSAPTLMVFSPEREYAMAYQLSDDKLIANKTIPNFTKVKPAPGVKKIIGYTAIEEKDVDGVYYIASNECSVSLEEMTVSGIRTSHYGMIWKEAMSDEERKLYMAEKGMGETEIQNMDNNSLQTYFALFRSEADHKAENVSKILDFNTRVYVISEPYPGWAYVEDDDGNRGYVQSHAINTRMPSPNSEMYRIESGDTLEKIIIDKLGSKKDRRFYANAILHINNPDNSEGGSVRLKGGFSLRSFLGLTDYSKFEVVAGKWMWIPDEAYAAALEGQVASGSTHEEIEQKVNELINPVVDYFDKLWPVGLGFEIEGNVGVTFGIPVGIDVDIITAFHRVDNDHFIIRKYIRGGVGLDTGVGYGIYLGNEKGMGLGAEAGANAKAMLAAYSDVEFKFPFKEDSTLITMLASLMEKPKPNSGGLFTEFNAQKTFYQFLNAATGIQLDTSLYVSKTKAAIGISAQADASANAGLKTDSQRRSTHSSRYDRHKADDDPSAPNNMFLRMLSISAGANVKSEAFLGADMEVKERDPDTREIVNAKGAVFVDLSAQGNVSIPFLPAIGMDLGGEAKLIFEYTRKDGWIQTGAGLVFKSGELQSYQGPGMEISADFENEELSFIKNNGIQDIEHLLELLSKIKFKKRFELLSTTGLGRFNAIKRRQEGVKSLLGENYKKVGANLAFYLTLELDFGKFLNADSLDRLVKIIGDIARTIKEQVQGTTIQDIFQHLLSVITEGKALYDTSIFNPLWEYFLLSGGLEKAEFTTAGDVGFAAGANVAALEGKVRVEGGVGLGGHYSVDIRDDIYELITSGYSEGFIKELFSPDNGASN
jgi:hypothetical protein